MNLLAVVRWIHILAGAAWLGEVATVVFVLIPLISKMEPAEQKNIIANVFPRIFSLASTLAVITLIAGVVLNYLVTAGWSNLFEFTKSPRGFTTILGGLLGLVLAGFHFTIENLIRDRVIALPDASPGDEVDVTRYLRIIPRVGLGVLILIFVLMMLGARGF
jgi:putative copper export protein